jgi:hypothetical protein
MSERSVSEPLGGLQKGRHMVGDERRVRRVDVQMVRARQRHVLQQTATRQGVDVVLQLDGLPGPALFCSTRSVSQWVGWLIGWLIHQ